MCIYICSHFAQVLVTFTLCDLSICAVLISAHMATVVATDAHLGGAGRGGDDDDDPNKKWKGEWPLNL